MLTPYIVELIVNFSGLKRYLLIAKSLTPKKIQPQLICRTVYSAGYTHTDVSDGIDIIASFTVYPECAREYQTFQITDNVAGANFRVYLLKSDSSEYISGSYGATGYPPAGTYYWAVENQGCSGKLNLAT